MSEEMPSSCGRGGKVPPIRICRRKICWETMGYLCHPEQTNLMPSARACAREPPEGVTPLDILDSKVMEEPS